MTKIYYTECKMINNNFIIKSWHRCEQLQVATLATNMVFVTFKFKYSRLDKIKK